MSENIKKDKIEELKNLRKITLFDKINEYIISVQGLKIKDKVIFFRLLATMLNSGITVMKALSILEKQEKNKIVKNIFFSMGNMLEDGKNLSEAMIEFPNSFTDAEIGMVKAGEKT
jgi:type IV pilus assembly protein PilC